MIRVARFSSRFGSVGELMDALAGLRARKKGLFVQVFDAKAVVSERHLLLAYENARLAFAEKRNFAGRMEAEVLARAAGTGRINEAIARVGAKDAGNVIVMFGGVGKNELVRELGAKELRPTFTAEEREVAKRFGIHAKMLAAYGLERTILERVAIADVE